jgi:hypothetical protein
VIKCGVVGPDPVRSETFSRIREKKSFPILAVPDLKRIWNKNYSDNLTKFDKKCLINQNYLLLEQKISHKAKSGEKSPETYR